MRLSAVSRRERDLSVSFLSVHGLTARSSALSEENKAVKLQGAEKQT